MLDISGEPWYIGCNKRDANHTMNLVDKLRERVDQLDSEAFIRLYPGYYLYGEIPLSDELGFKTRVAGPQAVIGILNGRRAGGAIERFVQRVEKTDRNTWARRISVGRATNNDIVIRHPSISKLHAHFCFSANGEQGSPAAPLQLTDADSANGTRVNGQAVGADHPVELTPGDRLRFGEIECELLDARALHRKIKRLYGMASGPLDDF